MGVMGSLNLFGPMPNPYVYHRTGRYTIKIAFSSVELGLMK